MAKKRVIKITHDGEFKRTYHVKAKLKTKENLKLERSLLEVLKKSHDAITQIVYNDECSVTITIGTAWAGDWKKIEKTVLGILIDRTDWLYGKVHVYRPKKKSLKLKVKVVRIITEGNDIDEVIDWGKIGVWV
jgi:hypothetical protein